MIDEQGFASFAFWGAFFSWLAGTICIAVGVEWGIVLIALLVVFVISSVILLSEVVDETGNRPLVALAVTGGVMSLAFWISSWILVPMGRLPVLPTLIPVGVVSVLSFGYLVWLDRGESRKRKKKVKAAS